MANQKARRVGSGFTATAGDTQVSLSWSNPTDSDFAGVMIRRRSDSFPTSATDGTQVTDTAAADTGYTDTGLTNGTAYFYTAFANDEVPNYAPQATGSAIPPSQGGHDGGGRRPDAAPEKLAASSNTRAADLAARIAPAIRGCLALPTGDDDHPYRPSILEWRASDETLDVLRRSDARDLAATGPLTGDHLIHTKALAQRFNVMNLVLVGLYNQILKYDIGCTGIQFLLPFNHISRSLQYFFDRTSFSVRLINFLCRAVN